MEDSFFGFDDFILGDGSGRIAEPSEEEYDALNDETFGSEINGDWEEAHECLVKLRDSCNDDSDGTGSKKKPLQPQNFLKHEFDRMVSPVDVDSHLSERKLNNHDMKYGHNENNLTFLDHVKENFSGFRKQLTLPEADLNTSSKISPQCTNSHDNSVKFLTQHFGIPLEQPPLVDPATQNGIAQKYALFTSSSPKISTLEDIERNLIMQQAMQNLQQNTAMPQFETIYDEVGNVHNAKALTSLKIKKTVPHSHASGTNQFQKQRTSKSAPHNITQHALGNLLVQPQSSVGMRVHNIPSSPTSSITLGNGHAYSHPLLLHHRFPMNYSYAVPQLSLPNSHLPVALNNFAMHPSFNAMRSAATLMSPQQPTRLPPQPFNTAPLMKNAHPSAMFNMSSSRLVQEIQLNHPMLQNVPKQQSINPHCNVTQKSAIGAKNRSFTGNMPYEEDDEYANLMSTRDKHWLISIQLSQLNTETPYIDDYYFTVYKEKKAELTGSSCQSRTHKDNQLNHPLTQPRGHAQLVLVQLGNKNGARNCFSRERHLSETGNSSNFTGSTQDLKAPHVVTPLKFENSLGKLQYGSVTAPRKIIDADIMSGDVNSSITEHSNNVMMSKGAQTAFETQPKSMLHTAFSQSNTIGQAMGDMTLLAQRKLRHILLHIETLFRVVLKLEDLDDPKAMAAILMKNKKENERVTLLEQLENANKTVEERAAEIPSQPIRNKFTYEVECKEVLLKKLETGLTLDKVIAIMNVRKGKILIRRIMSLVRENPVRWQIWHGVFASLQFVLKKDREDVDGVLFGLYPELKNQIKGADFETVVELSKLMPTNEKKSGTMLSSKFVIASLVCLIIRTEEIYAMPSGCSLTNELQNDWKQFLKNIAISLNGTIQNHTICVAIESDCIELMMTHLARFKDLKLDSLLTLVTEANEKIN